MPVMGPDQDGIALLKRIALKEKLSSMVIYEGEVSLSAIRKK